MITNSNGIGILYVGNRLTSHGYNPTGIDLLSARLSQDFKVYTASARKDYLGRMIDMIRSIWVYRHRIGLVLIDTYSSKAFYYAVLCGLTCRLLHIRYIPILRGGDLPSRITRNPGLARFLFKSATTNVSPSSYLRMEFEKQGYRVTSISNFIPVADYPYHNRTQVNPRLLYVRAYQKLYNPILAVRVLKEIALFYPDATLCMIGPDKDGSLETVRKETEVLELIDKVKILGRLEKKEWITIAKEYDFFINTTNYDNMPVSVMEAMALGMIVISTNVGGVPALIDHEINGILVNPNDKDAFVHWIRRLIEDPTLAARISAAAREKALLFDWAVVGPQWNRLIKRKLNAAHQE